jgi:hypothetical protein
MVLSSHLPVCPGHPHGQTEPGLHQPVPDELLIMPPAVVKVDTDSIVSREQEDKLLGEEVAVVLRMEEEKGIRGITNGGED